MQGALFDMDGLLLDTERLGMDVFCSVIAGHGLGAAEAEALYRSMVGKSLEIRRRDPCGPARRRH